jgi:tRNA threonylcarbamoyladenosine biosynthesis protein TsaB
MNILLIDTSDNKKITVGLRIESQEDIVVQEVGREKAQAVLPILDSLLKKHQLTLQDLTGLEVNVGPGSFTGLRVGIAIANTLGHSLNIPINGGKPGEPVEARYN